MRKKTNKPQKKQKKGQKHAEKKANKRQKKKRKNNKNGRKKKISGAGGTNILPFFRTVLAAAGYSFASSTPTWSAKPVGSAGMVGRPYSTGLKQGGPADELLLAGVLTTELLRVVPAVVGELVTDQL